MEFADVDRGQRVFDHIWVTSRSIREYVEYFQLTDADLKKTILDCPAGAASFVAHVNANGGNAIAADLSYTLPFEELAAKATQDLDDTTSTHDKNPDLLSDGIFASTEDLIASRKQSLEFFLNDRLQHPDFYVPVELPKLPFADNSFDLVLSPYLLFCYGDRLSLDFHRASILEMLRVAREEVRLTPICEAGGIISPWRDQLFSELAQHAEVHVMTDINCTLRPATESLQLRKIP